LHASSKHLETEFCESGKKCQQGRTERTRWRFKSAKKEQPEKDSSDRMGKGQNMKNKRQLGWQIKDKLRSYRKDMKRNESKGKTAR
jgi:hypothetical protein